ncbi:hypothetical protein [Chondromyces apiculatus]|uniref:hypothetical protein n=1 Tax=Chondromyces apiculatus TaxID=51 RepID=UPI0012DCD8A0|nr:hypothetical protein [Chondromyces apiculatus]
MTSNLKERLRNDGVEVERVSFPSKWAEFLDACEAQGEFNVLILVAHGEVKDDDLESTPVHTELTGTVVPWAALAQANIELNDKLVMLASCGGYSKDTVDAFVRTGQLALYLLASKREVTPDEVLAVFPRVLKELQKEANREGSFSGEQLEAARERCDVTNAFMVTSGVGILP